VILRLNIRSSGGDLILPVLAAQLIHPILLMEFIFGFSHQAGNAGNVTLNAAGSVRGEMFSQHL
jgi:hypothetical protein